MNLLPWLMCFRQRFQRIMKTCQHLQMKVDYYRRYSEPKPFHSVVYMQTLLELRCVIVYSMQKNNVPENFPSNNALKAFEPIIGVWNTVGTHPMISDTTLHGRTSFDWHEAGAFIIMHSSIEESGVPTGVAIIGGDEMLGTYSMIYFDERGVSRICHVSMQSNIFRWWRDAPGFHQRYSLTVSEDQQSIVGKGELSKDGSNWEKDLDLDYTKANV